MKAYIYTNYGAPEVLRIAEVETPEPTENQVLIKTYATSVSSGDWRARSLTMPAGMGFIGRLVFGIFAPRQQILGSEFSGVVEKIGAGVTKFKPGEAVIAYPGAKFGGYGEFCLMPENGSIIKKSDGISFEDAAALSFGGVTAYDFLVNKAEIWKGARVLINGASGSTGVACVQIAKLLGAEVTGVCSAGNMELVRRLGADHVIDYRVQDFATNGQQYDFIVDTVGNAGWKRVKDTLAPKGKLVVIAGGLYDMVVSPLLAKFSGKQVVGGVSAESPLLMQTLVDLVLKGDFRVVVEQVYQFDQMVAAHAHMDTGRKIGNLVVSFENEVGE